MIAPAQNRPQSTQPERKILDVGCGQNKHPGAIGIDSNPRAHADVIHDLGTLPYPFPDDEFDLIICRHVIEHVPDVMSFVVRERIRKGPEVVNDICMRTRVCVDPNCARIFILPTPDVEDLPRWLS